MKVFVNGKWPRTKPQIIDLVHNNPSLRYGNINIVYLSIDEFDA